ncbi:MAG: beta strand repeat-containing protein [Gemmatimonadales bacterium]
MHLARRVLLLLLTPGLLLVSCVSREGPTGPGGEALIGLALQPALIPSAADGTALPVNRVRAVVTRTSDSAVLADLRFDVSPSDATWALDLAVPAGDQATEVVVLLYLLNVATDGTEAVQFSGRSAPLSLASGTVAPNVDVDIVRGPPSNLSVTGVSITQAPDTLEVGESAVLGATVTTSAAVAAEVYWTSLSSFVVDVVDSVATGVNQGLTEIVASSGAFADTVQIVVVPAAVASVLVSPDSADVQVDATRPYSVVLRDARGVALTGPPVLWETLDSAVAVVDQAGVVLGLAPGTTRVRATSQGVSDEAVVRVTTPVAPGAGVTWTRGSGGVWSDPANWTPARVPLATDTVYLNQGVDYAVTLDVDATVAHLEIGGTSDVINLNVGDHTLTITDPVAGLVIQPLGRLEIASGSLVVREASSYGAVYTTGVATIDAGFESYGDWTVASGVLTLIDPSGFSYLYNEGTITVAAGAVLGFDPFADLEFAGGAITGTGSLLFQLGSRLLMYADLVLDGPNLTLDGVELDVSGTRRVTIGPASSLLLLSGQAPVSVWSTLEVQGGLYATGPEVITADSLIVAASGSVVVEGTGTGAFFETTEVENFGSIALIGSSDVRFGPGANDDRFVNRAGATLTFAPGAPRTFNGLLVNEGDVYVAAPSILQRQTPGGSLVDADHVNAGLVEIAAGGSLAMELGGASPTFTNTGTVTIGATATLSVTNLSSAAAATVINDVTGVLSGTGTMQFVPGGSLPDPTGINSGVIAPGLSPGALAWQGSVPMGPTGVIAIELEGTTPGTGHDVLTISSDLILNLNQGLPTGGLAVTAPGFTPAPGDTLTVLTFRERLGNFASVSLPTFAGVTLDTVWTNNVGVAPDTLYLVATAGSVPPIMNAWTNVLGGNWSDGANWSMGVAPTAADSVVIDLAGTYTVTLDVNATVGSLTLGGASGTQTLSGAFRTVTLAGVSDVRPSGRLALTSSTVNGTGSLTNQGAIASSAGTWSVPITNLGTIDVGGTVAFNGALTMVGGSLLRVGGIAGNSVLNVASGFTNAGTIELTNVSAGYSATLNVTTGTLVNTGTLASVAPIAGGNRTLGAELDNQGTLTVSWPLTISRTGAAHVNSVAIDVGTQDLTVTQTAGGSFTNTSTGSVTVAGGLTWTVNGGTLDVTQGSVSGAGTLDVGSGATFQFTTGTVTTPLIIRSGVSVPGGITVPSGETLRLLGSTVLADPITIENGGTVLQTGTVGFNGALTMAGGSLLRVGGIAGNSVLNVASGFTNAGTIELTNVSAGYSATLNVTTGTLVNTGTLASVAPIAGGNRTLGAELDNQGTLTVSWPLTISRTGAAHVNSVAIDVGTQDLTVTQTAGGSFTNTSTGSVTVAGGLTWTVNGGTLDVTQGSVSGAGTLDVGSGATFQFTTGTVTTPLIIRSGVSVPGGITVPSGETLRLLGSTVLADPITIENGGTVLQTGTVGFNGALTMAGGSLLRVGGIAGNSVLNVASGFTNAGTIELTNVSAGYSATLNVTTGTLVNTGTLAVLAPITGGTRTLGAELDNQGTLTLSWPLNLFRTGAAAHVNNSTIDVSVANLTVTMSSGTFAGSFTNNGTINVANNRTLTLTGGSVDLDQGLVSGAGTLYLAGSTAAQLTTATVTTPLQVANGVTIPGGITVPSNETLQLVGFTTISDPIVLQSGGTIQQTGTTEFNGALTMATGSVLRVGGLAGNSTLTVANGFTNAGTIELTNATQGYSATLNVTTGTLVNTGTLAILAPITGGSRTISAALIDNLDTFLVDWGLTVSGALNQNDVLTVSSGRTMTVTGLLTLSAGTTVVDGTLVASGGCTDAGGGPITGSGTYPACP